jgi:CRISPR-associated protein Cmr4
MKKMIMTLFARTPVHVGAGNSVGAVDSPIQRERHTRIPIIPGSSLKGVLADLWTEDYEKNEKGKLKRKEDSPSAWLFGNESDKNAASGALLIGEARVLAFPVRSAKGMFAWITCPLVLRRFQRETSANFTVPEVTGETALASEVVKLKDSAVVLEEYAFKVTGTPDAAIVEAFKPLVPNDVVWSGIKDQLVIVSDEIFQHFCEHACEVVTRIKIDDETGTVDGGALFNQEQVPSETLFYTLVLAQDEKKKGGGSRKMDEALSALKTKLEEQKWLQVGGDATIGLGFCTVNCKEIN